MNFQSDVNQDSYSRGRRAAQLTLGCIANIAGYRAGWCEADGRRQLVSHEDFWVRVNGNFLDHAALDWCKLFMDRTMVNGGHRYGCHHWRTVLPEGEHGTFLAELDRSMGMRSCDRDRACIKIKRYRDKVLAHLDEPQEGITYPLTEHMLLSASALYDWLVRDDGFLGHYVGVPKGAKAYYEDKLSEAKGHLTHAQRGSVQ